MRRNRPCRRRKSWRTAPSPLNVHAARPLRLEPLEHRLVLTATFDLATLDGTNGFTRIGFDAHDLAGYSVNTAGDVNGDGFDDVIVSTPQTVLLPAHAGKAFVLFGQETPFLSVQALTNVNGTNGFAITGSNLGDHTGVSVSSAGDVNGDGFHDLIIGADGANGSGGNHSGITYIMFGKASGFSANVDLNTFGPPDGFRIIGAVLGDYAGTSVSSAGDVNGDGLDDLLIGARSAGYIPVDSPGQAYMLFGRSTPFPFSISLFNLDPPDGFPISGLESGDFTGVSVSSADVNGDGYDDLLIGAPLADGNPTSGAGKSFVVFGGITHFDGLLLTDLDGLFGFEIAGSDVFGEAGRSISSAGDFNGDGFEDILIGAPFVDPYSLSYAGESYIVFGHADPFPASFELSSLDGSNGFAITSPTVDGGLGFHVSAAGDVNGDGFDDVILGAPFADAVGLNAPGEAFVLFGSPAPFSPVFDLDDLDGTNGIHIPSIDPSGQLGKAVGPAGDVNGDGFDDIILGAPEADNYSINAAGASYTIFGTDFSSAVTHAGDSNANLLVGTPAAEVFVAGQDDDTLIGAGGADVLRAAQGDDLIRIEDLTFRRVDGGRGFDTLQVGDFDLDLAQIADNRITGIEAFDLATTPGTQKLTLSEHEVLRVSDTSNTVVVYGTADDVVDFSLFWTFTGTEFIGPDEFNVFTRFEATLKISVDVPAFPMVPFGHDLGDLFASAGGDGSEGVVFTGIDPSDYAGFSVSDAGDVNGDGFDDFLVGASGADPNGDSAAGEFYLVFGQASGYPAQVELASLDGTNGFTLLGIDPGDGSRRSAENAGDVNGDGFADFLVAAHLADPDGKNEAGEAYLIFGHAGPFDPTLDLAALDGTNGVQFTGIDVEDRAGYSVNTAGDINGDGLDDIVIGAHLADPGGLESAGEAYVFFGTKDPLPANIDLDSLDGTNGFQLTGFDEADGAGQSVSSAGDVNGDGLDDLLIGAPSAGPFRKPGAGAVFVVYGKTTAFPASFDLASIDGSNGFELRGIARFDGAGYSVDNAGDFNGDGFDDVLVSLRLGDGFAGGSYLVFGTDAGFPAFLDLADLDGTNGFALNPIDFGDSSGHSTSAAGDVNGDGYDDLLIGAFFAAQGAATIAGESYLVFGHAGPFSDDFELDELDGDNGFALFGNEQTDASAFAVSTAGDFNGDGFQDLLIGTPGGDAPPDLDVGETYLYFGDDFTSAVTHPGDDTANLLTGTAAADSIIAGQDNDTLIGAGGADVLRAAQGDDLIAIGDATFFRADGGRGFDTLELGNFDLDLTAIPDNRLTGIEAIDLAASAAANTLTLTKLELLNLSDSSNTLRVRGTAADTADLGPGTWTRIAKQTIDSELFHIYTQDHATLLVSAPMNLVGAFVIAADFNGDGSADALDANILSLNWLDFPAGGATLADGDANGDGKVDALDANILSLNWLAELPSALAQEATAATADPITAGISADLLANLAADIAANFTQPTTPDNVHADLNADGLIDALDANRLTELTLAADPLHLRWLAARLSLESATQSDSAGSHDTALDQLLGP